MVPTMNLVKVKPVRQNQAVPVTGKNRAKAMLQTSRTVMHRKRTKRVMTSLQSPGQAPMR